MKSSADPRHKKRVNLVKKLFAYTFSGAVDPSIKPIVVRIDEIDSIIKTSAPEWPIDKLNKIDISILRLAVYELLNKSAPEKVIIDEAVELGKLMGSENTASFVNGVLGNILKK